MLEEFDRKWRAMTVGAALTIISGCASYNTVIFKPTYNPLDATTAAFMLDPPNIDLSLYGAQASRPGQALRDVDVMLTASGGGQRSAAFTLGVLTELQSLKLPLLPDSDWLSEIDYFTSVSGGGWAVGAYLATRLDPAYSSWKMQDPRMQAEFRNRLRGIEMHRGSTCLSQKLGQGVTRLGEKELMFADVFVPPNVAPKVPYLFSTATIETNEYPFVFSKTYLERYRIESFEYCGKSLPVQRDLARVPVSVALATSASVPGFRQTDATTSICQGPLLQDSYACRVNPRLERMVLIDGGIYDNIGYKTAFDVLPQSKSKRKILVMVDASADSSLPFTGKEKIGNVAVMRDAMLATSVSEGHATYQRVIGPMSRSYGIESLTLRFSDVAGFRTKANAYEKRHGRAPDEGLEVLKQAAASIAECLSSATAAQSEDCKDNAYYRVGLSSRTSYAIDDAGHNALVELGRLVVRLRHEELLALMAAKGNR